jgi:hypothetical protein
MHMHRHLQSVIYIYIYVYAVCKCKCTLYVIIHILYIKNMYIYMYIRRERERNRERNSNSRCVLQISCGNVPDAHTRLTPSYHGVSLFLPQNQVFLILSNHLLHINSKHGAFFCDFHTETCQLRRWRSWYSVLCNTMQIGGLPQQFWWISQPQKRHIGGSCGIISNRINREVIPKINKYIKYNK